MSAKHANAIKSSNDHLPKYQTSQILSEVGTMYIYSVNGLQYNREVLVMTFFDLLTWLMV